MTRTTGSRAERERRPLPTCSRGAFGADYATGCPSCSAIADGFNGFAVHLAAHDVTLCAVSRSRWPRWPSCTPISSGWAGASRARPPTAATSTRDAFTE
jgi:predicted dithiol-disulfide oxidoreductase (DUF899 family)